MSLHFSQIRLTLDRTFIADLTFRLLRKREKPSL
jgi:hypothetical protein